MDKLYHYCENVKCFSILKSKTIRMSDIRKSNDFSEMQIFFPEIFDYIRKGYFDNPFPFVYEGLEGFEAISRLIEISSAKWFDDFSTGMFSSFVLCLSEECDSLSQWRGYAEDGKGGCIAFSYDALNHYCLNTNGVLRLEKVEYLSEKQINELLERESNEIILELRTMRKWIVDNMTYDENDPDTDGLLRFNFNGMIESFFVDSLRFKSLGFSKEKEWRVFFSTRAYKNPEWVNGHEKIGFGPNGFAETISFLKNQIKFSVTSNDLVPYLPIDFADFEKSPLIELWVGPKNRMALSDVELFLKQNGYSEVKVIYSDITYR